MALSIDRGPSSAGIAWLGSTVGPTEATTKVKLSVRHPARTGLVTFEELFRLEPRWGFSQLKRALKHL